ncbi:MAG: hypothetical protein OEV48_12215 [Acidobacteriota bacterium]|jgi:hypothetical protein|nr:hypothetical protein [Acidobacteriota bacterium]
MRRPLAIVFCVALLTVVSAPTFAASGGHLDGYIPAVANTKGRFGSFWTSDLWIYHQGATVIHLWLNKPGQDNTDGQSVVINLDEPVVFIPDVVGTVFGTEGSGSLHYIADGPVTVTSRTWTPGEEGGSYGLTLPGRPVSAASFAGSGQAGALRVVVNQRSGFRANFGVVNVTPVAVTVLVEIFTADGELAPGDSSFTLDLEPFGMTQVNDILKRLTAGERDGLIIRAGVTSDEGAIFSYLTDVDNTTNDSSYQAGFRFAF